MTDPLIIAFTVLIAAILLHGAIHKMMNGARFTAQLGAYQLLPESGLHWVSRSLPVIESVTAGALLIPGLPSYRGRGRLRLAGDLWRRYGDEPSARTIID